MTTHYIIDELREKVGSKWFFADDYTLANKLNYISGILLFDKYLDGKTLKQIHAVIHITKYPKGLVIKIAKLFSTYPFGVAYTEIKKVLLKKSSISNLIFELNDNNKIIFSLKTSDIFEVKEFLDDIHLKYEYIETKSQGEEKKNEHSRSENSSYKKQSEHREDHKHNEEEQNNQSSNDSNTNGMTKEKAFEILGVKRNASKEEIKKAYRTLVKKYNTDQRTQLEDHIKQMLEEKMKELNNAKDYLEKIGLL